jgi:Acetoacetate decarboxylase (ADC)
LMAVFTIDAQAAAGLLPGQELHPLRLPGGRGVLVITVIDYTSTNIGKYIEFSIAIGVTHGRRPAPPLLPLLWQRHYDMGQFVYDLPVSTEISVKGGKGIWGMPKHQANLDFQIGRRTVSSQYDLDGQLAMRITIRKPRWTGLPLRMGSSNFCAFRGMLWKSSLYFHGQIGASVLSKGAAELLIGDHPRAAPLKQLDIGAHPLLTAYFPASAGILDDHLEGWFLASDDPPVTRPEGLESVVDLSLSEAWLAPPTAQGRSHD